MLEFHFSKQHRHDVCAPFFFAGSGGRSDAFSPLLVPFEEVIFAENRKTKQHTVVFQYEGQRLYANK